MKGLCLLLLSVCTFCLTYLFCLLVSPYTRVACLDGVSIKQVACLSVNVIICVDCNFAHMICCFVNYA